MPANVRTQAESQLQRNKLANSYNELLDEFNSKDLRTVGNYSLGRLIGKGSFGKVYLAGHKLTNGSKVVLKSAKKDDPNLAREIHHHRQFLHPHIARLYEVIVTETLVWLALEYCPGDELYNHLINNGPMEPAKVQKIFTQLVGAVSYVHNKSCVHRDLKLENILLDKHENVKLVDFGFTREYEGKSSYLTTWCGTVCYSAPEMLKGEKYAGEKVDVWSLGIILYALLCGELPFDDDDEMVTKMRILKEEPKYTDKIPPLALDLIKQLLSKRTLLRPSLAEVLQHPWLAEHAPQQQAILKLQQPAPFTTQLEKDVLQRMRSAGVDIDQVIENVLAQRCDSLAGWWALLLEKEERKEARRQRKRKEREAEAKSLRRLSATSQRLERLAPTIKEVDEQVQSHSPLLELPEKDTQRGRSMRKANGSPVPPLPGDAKTKTHAAAVPDLPKVTEVNSRSESIPPPPIEKDSIRSTSSSRHRPPLPPKEVRRSRGSMLQVVSTNPDLLSPNGFVPKKRRKYQAPFLGQLASLKHWFKETSKRARSPNSKGSSSKTPSPKIPQGKTDSPGSNSLRRQSTGQGVSSLRQSVTSSTNSSHLRAEPNTRSTYPQRPRITTNLSSQSGGRSGRPSVSPSPLTPHSSYRRSSAGLRGRKSTSSSISSIRSIHQHHHSHSKASSTSSNSIHSPSVSISGKTPRSPHASVKVLPATPTTSSFPSSIRIGRGTPNHLPNFPFSSPPGSATAATAAGSGGLSNERFGPALHLGSLTLPSNQFSSIGPPSPGLPVFAKRRRSPFKGPMLSGLSSSSAGTASPGSRGRGDGSRSTSVQGRRSGEMAIMEEEEEDEEDAEIEVLMLEGDGMAEGEGEEEMEVEEVDAFSPVTGPGEFVWRIEEGVQQEGVKG